MKSGVRDENALVFSFFAHVDPSSLCNLENMRWVLIPALSAILLDDGIGIQGQMLVWIDCDQEQSRVGLQARERVNEQKGCTR